MFTLNTNDCVSFQPNQFVVKFSDDIYLQATNVSSYKSEVDRFVDWCDEHINVWNTEEIVLDPRLIGDHSSVAKHSQDINQVTNYKWQWA